jgi:hypothetical protein
MAKILPLDVLGLAMGWGITRTEYVDPNQVATGQIGLRQSKSRFVPKAHLQARYSSVDGFTRSRCYPQEFYATTKTALAGIAFRQKPQSLSLIWSYGETIFPNSKSCFSTKLQFLSKIH